MAMDPKARPYFAPATQDWTPKLHELRETNGLGQVDPAEAAHQLADEAGLGMFDPGDPLNGEREDQLIRALQYREVQIAGALRTLQRQITGLGIAVIGLGVSVGGLVYVVIRLSVHVP